MIYLFYGEDEDKARAKWRAAVAAFAKKHPTGMIFRFSAKGGPASGWDPAQFEELILGGGLFGEKRLIVCDQLLENKEAETFVADRIKEIALSLNTFLLLETSLSADWVKKINKADGKAEEFKLALKSAAAPFNIFSINDAFVDRDRKRLWLAYQKALAAGISEEEIFWKLAWQVKTMLLVEKLGDKQPKTLKPFVIGKARRGLRHFQPDDLEKISGDLVRLWHDARRGLLDFDIGLEKLVLSI